MSRVTLEFEGLPALPEVSPGLYAHVPVLAIVEDEPRPGLSVVFDVQRTPEGFGPRQIGVRASEGEQISATDWRGVKPSALWREVGLFLLMEGAPAEHDSVDIAPAKRPTTQEIANLRTRGPVNETLHYVAARYQEALVASIPPAQHVQESFAADGDLDPLPRTTATKWIQRARQQGLIRGDD